MYMHIGSGMNVRDTAGIWIFDLDNTTVSKHTRALLSAAEENGSVVSVTEDLPRAFVLTEEYGMERIYLTQLSFGAIERRSRESFEFSL